MKSIAGKSLFAVSILSLFTLGGCAADVQTEPNAEAAEALIKLPPRCLWCDQLFKPTSDARFEVGFCVHDLAADSDAAIIDGLRAQFAGQFGYVDVQSACNADRSKERIGVWTTPGDANARMSELASEDTMLSAGESLATYFTAGLVQNAVNRAWAAQPKDISGPTSDSIWWFANDVHLYSIDPVRLVAPNQVITSVHGVADVFIAGIKDPLSVTSTTTDTVMAVDGLPTCTTSVYQQVAWPGPDSTKTDGGGGAGCSFIRSLPTSLAVPDGKKLLVTYVRAGVEASAGITAGARVGLLPVPRQPTAAVHGPSVIVFDMGEKSTSGSFSVDTSDMRGPVTVTWSGGSTKSTGTTAEVVLTAPPGTVASRTVTATVTDVDGLRATASMNVQLQRDPCSTGNPHIPNCN